jgi:ABC-type dipeptide/oligopeptide/nickel transport system permease component
VSPSREGLARSGALVLPWFVVAAAFAVFYARMARGNLIETTGEELRPTAIPGTVLFGAFFMLTANIVVDVLYTVLDPRVRHG